MLKLKPTNTIQRAKEVRLREFSAHSRGKLDVGVHVTKGTTPRTKEIRSREFTAWSEKQ